ncbi:MAG: RNA methyltransferase [Spirochaetes bacterium]|nr:MAG: RNA methyltransferase [Spirochaetota bacterium]
MRRKTVIDAGLFAGLKDRDLRREGIVIAEGRLLVDRMLASGWEVLCVLAGARMADEYAARAGGNVPLLVKSDAEMEALAGFRFHRGVMAASRRPSSRTVCSCVEDNPSIEKVVICPDIGSPANLGSIMRTAAAFGYGGLIIGPQCCDPLSRMALKASMGAPFKMLLADMGDEALDCAFLKRNGFALYGTVLSESATPLHGFAPARRHALVFGNEATGLSAQWRALCDKELTIPIESHTDSLNVGVAAGIFMHCLGGMNRD